MAIETRVLYEFAGFRLDPGQHLLVHDGKAINLTPKAFELLLVLIQSNGHLLSKEELMNRIWPNSFVEEANLTVNISALRKTLGDRPDGQAYIETVPKRGYRFVAQVTELLEEGQTARPNVRIVLRPDDERRALKQRVQTEPSSAATEPRLSRKLIVAVLIAAVAVLAIVGIGVLLYRQRVVPSRVVVSRRLAILP